ncbi:MAG: MBL fold metallo-hydrolase, partial [Coprobacillus cateniformis]
LQKRSGCPIYASYLEKEWFENVDKQFADRPIPRFYHLLQNSVHVDMAIERETEIMLEDYLSMKIILTPGHSHGSLSFLFNYQILFTGDAIPVVGDIPIYTHVYQTLKTLNTLLNIQSIDYYCPAWDVVYQQEMGKEKIRDAIHLIESIDECVQRMINDYPSISYDRLFELVCYQMKMEVFKQNPLFKKTILSHIYYQCYD